MKTNTLLGLDIQADAVRMMHIIRHKKQISVDWFVETSLPSECIFHDKIIHFEKFSELIKTMLSEKKCHKQRTAIALPTPFVKVQKISVPKGLKHAAILTEINRVVQKELQVTTQKIAIDYVSNQQNEFTEEITFAVTQQNYLSQYLASVAQAGLEVKIVDIHLYANVRAWIHEANIKLNDNENTVIVCATQYYLEIIVIHAQTICFYQHTLHDHQLDFAWQELWQAYQCHVEMNIHNMVIVAAQNDVSQLQSLVIDVCSNIAVITQFTQWREAQQKLVLPLSFATALGLAMRVLSL